MDRELWLIWKNPKNESRRRYKIGRLHKNPNGYVFEYSDDIEEAHRNGLECYPGFNNLKEVYKSKTLFSNIASRIPSRERKDYLDIINVYNLSPRSSDMEVLEATRGRLPTDNFEFVQAIDESGRLEFNIAGTRYHQAELQECIDLLKPNTELLLRHNPTNQYDKNAIEVYCRKGFKELLIGYVPRFYAEYLADHLDAGASYSALVKQVRLDSNNHDEKFLVEVKIVIA